MRDNDTEILLQSGLLCAADSNSSIVKGCPILTLSIQLFFLDLDHPCLPWKTV
ncbi:hypothetical protein DPMN_158058 [Dreissena polymorpha]|uniref:Uncharacterized protein n=1 Tax=Dreissena polymorpha TaxID=45954 RepID=A0A9D4EII3_DREPO|nr:hypothetical protein DPMN_158058 [Dreissena polymorpha]